MKPIVEYLDALALVRGAGHHKSVVQTTESSVKIDSVFARRSLENVDTLAESNARGFQLSNLLDLLTELNSTPSRRSMCRYSPKGAREKRSCPTAAIRPQYA